jgi:hypothetical protein
MLQCCRSRREVESVQKLLRSACKYPRTFPKRPIADPSPTQHLVLRNKRRWSWEQRQLQMRNIQHLPAFIYRRPVPSIGSRDSNTFQTSRRRRSRSESCAFSPIGSQNGSNRRDVRTRGDKYFVYADASIWRLARISMPPWGFVREACREIWLTCDADTSPYSCDGTKLLHEGRKNIH